jgi:carbon monoxide dehydrogenase subunit G
MAARKIGDKARKLAAHLLQGAAEKTTRELFACIKRRLEAG